jgi:hypothetical protein
MLHEAPLIAAPSRMRTTLRCSRRIWPAPSPSTGAFAGERLFGAVPSDSTLYRTFRQLGPATLAGLWEAIASIRAQVWRRSSVTNTAEPVVLDIDATLV